MKNTIPGRLPQFGKDKLERWVVDRQNQLVLNEKVVRRKMRSAVFRHNR
jgi:hypothetical protein